MAMEGWVYLLAAIRTLAFAMAHNHIGETEIYRVSAGHLFLLMCRIPGAHSNVTWSRGGGHNMSLPTGVDVRQGLLWFLPVQASHSGLYICETRGITGLLRMMVRVSVSSEECPDASETISVTHGVGGGLPCKQTEIFKMKNEKKIRWMKDCRPVQPLFVRDNGFMGLSAVSEEDAGTYTCLVDISVDGRAYTAARSIQMTLDNDTVVAEPQVVFPHNAVIVVEVGIPVELKCLALIGSSEDEDTLMHWTVGTVHSEDYEGLNDSWKFVRDAGRVYGLSTLSVPEVRPHLLNVPIRCYVSNSVGRTVGVVQLQQADLSVLYTTVALWLVAPLALLTLGAVLLLCKVDLVLAHRKLLRPFSKRQVPEGKRYDGYVSFPSPQTSSSAETVNFALQLLPDELENKHGYSLYVRGRDDCPGDAFHDTIAATIRQCRRLIIILSPTAKPPPADDKGEEARRDDHMRLGYEQMVGLYDALTQNNPRVILVEVDGPVDYSHLPESLRYIRRRQGALNYVSDPSGTHPFPKLCSNRSFWKTLRYHMPSVPAARCKITV